MKMIPVQWRTAVVVIFLGAAMVLMLIVCGHFALSSEFFGHAVTGCIGLGTVMGSKSAIEHATNGGGLWGGVKAIFTKAKPEGTPPAAPAEPQQ